MYPTVALEEFQEGVKINVFNPCLSRRPSITFYSRIRMNLAIFLTLGERHRRTEDFI